MSESPLRLLLDFDACSQRDQDQPPAFLHRRDRKFALTCQPRGTRATARAWIDQMERLSGPGGAAGASARVLDLWRRIHTGFAVVGILAGITTMSGLLFYDGGQRINITVFLAFVALQLMLALFTSIQSLAGWQPWRWLLTRLGLSASPGVTGKLQPLLMARAAHLGGCCFALAGLLTLLVMVVVQDLAFGWSTTLDTASASYHRLVTALATPWSWLWPAAVPDPALVEATRFFRTGSAAVTDPGRWGQWWPFVTMLWLTWVLLPRLVLSLFTALMIRRRAHRLLASHPAMHALLYRMETPVLDTGNDHNDAGDLPDTHTRSALQPLPASSVILCWADAGEQDLPRVLTGPDTRVFRAGGRTSLAQDQETLSAIGNILAASASPAVILLARSWEPPTGELSDFLEAAKAQWPDRSRVALVPLAKNPDQPPGDHHLAQWLRFAERMAPGFVGVSAPGMEGVDPQKVSEELS